MLTGFKLASGAFTPAADLMLLHLIVILFCWVLVPGILKDFNKRFLVALLPALPSSYTLLTFPICCSLQLQSQHNTFPLCRYHFPLFPPLPCTSLTTFASPLLSQRGNPSSTSSYPLLSLRRLCSLHLRSFPKPNNLDS